MRSRYIGNLNTYEATVSIERLSRLGLVSPKTIYKLKKSTEAENFIQESALQTLFPTNVEPNILGQTLHSIIIEELNSEFLKPDKRKEYGLEG